MINITKEKTKITRSGRISGNYKAISYCNDNDKQSDSFFFSLFINLK